MLPRYHGFSDSGLVQYSEKFRYEEKVKIWIRLNFNKLNAFISKIYSSIDRSYTTKFIY